MVQRGVLLRIPNMPFSVDDLCPSHYLATAGALLEQAGWQITIADAGSVESLKHAQQTHPHTYRPELSRIDKAMEFNSLYTSHLHNSIPDAQPVDQNEGYHAFAEKFVAAIAHPSNRFVMMVVNHIKDLDTARAAIQRIRSHAPRTRIIGAGQVFQNSENQSVSAAKLFDCIYVGRADDQTLLQLADTADRPALWRNLPNLVHESGVSLRISRTEPGPLAKKLSPIYDICAYNGLNDETRLPIYDVEDILLAPVGTLGRWEVEQVRPASDVADDMVTASDPERCAGLSIVGSAPNIPHIERVAYELLKRRAQIRYSREAHIQSIVPQGLPSVHASGCRAIHFQIHSGSQRLVDDVYGDEFGINQAERVIRACKFSNMFTIAGFTYPCPEDDYHTRAETLHFIDRCRPNSVQVHPCPVGATPSRGWKSWFQNTSTAELNQRGELIHELEENGQVCSVSPKVALLAERVGQKGNEKRFSELLHAAIRRADVDVLSHLTNLALRPHPVSERTLLSFRPFLSKRHVVGN